MKICFFSHGSKDNQDGASLSMLNVMSELTKRGHQVIGVMGYDMNLEYYRNNPNIKFIFVRSYNMRQSLNYVRFKTNVHYYVNDKLNYYYQIKAYKLLKEEGVDIIHVNGINNGIGAKVAKMLDIPYVWHIRQLMEEDLGQRLFNWKTVKSLMKEADSVIAISQLVRNKFEPLIGREIEVIYNGVPAERYYNKHPELFKNDVINLILAGRVAEGKGQLEAAKAVDILVKKGISNVHLTLIGHVDSESYYGEIVSLIEKNNLHKYITIKEYEADLANVRRKADIGLCCSTKEAFGRVTIETMLSGMLFIGADTGATPELVEDGVNGYLYHYGNPENLAEVIMRCIYDSEKSKQIAAYAQQEAVGMYSIEHTVDQIEKIYGEIK